MPLARGLMSAERIKYYPTATTFPSISPTPGTAQCGQDCTFHITVTNLDGSPTPNIGTVQLYDSVSQSVLASATISGGSATIHYTFQTGSYVLLARYLGVEQKSSPPVVDFQFGASQTAPVIYNVAIATTNTSITAPTHGDSFCITTDFPVTAMVTSAGTVTNGTMEFRLWSDNSTFVTLPSAVVSGGIATSHIPAGTGTAGTTYYLQAIYDGTSCFLPSLTPPGVGGLDVTGSTALPTTTHVTITDSQVSFCPYLTKQFNITVTSDDYPTDPHPIHGNVELWADNGDFTYQVATGSLSGSNVTTVTVPANTLLYDFAVFGVYDGYGFLCNAPSSSTEISISPTTNNVSIQQWSTPTSVCAYTAQSYMFRVSSSHSGTISGTFKLWSTSSGSPLGTITTSGSSSGFFITFNSVFVPVGGQDLYVEFDHNSTSGCYGDTFDAFFFVNSQGLVSPGCHCSLNSSGDYTYQPITVYATVYHNGGFTSLSSTWYVEYYDPASHLHIDGPFSFVDFGEPSTNSHTYSYAPYGAGQYYFYVYYSGNNCYAGEISNAASYYASYPLH